MKADKDVGIPFFCFFTTLREGEFAVVFAGKVHGESAGFEQVSDAVCDVFSE